MANQQPVHVQVPVRIDFAGGWSDVPDFAAREGGAVVNAAISPYVTGHTQWNEQGLTFGYTLDLPADAHLGSSSSINVAQLRLTYGLLGRQVAATELAETAFRMEQLTGNLGGKQDQYAAALGGMHLLRFGAEADPAVAEPLRLTPPRQQALRDRLVLAYSNTESSSSQLHHDVWNRYRAGDERLASLIRSLRDSAYTARDALLAGNWPPLGTVLTHNYETSRLLHPDLIPARLDQLMQVGRTAGMLGAKACGAGGGGYLLFLVEPDRRPTLIDALHGQGIPSLDFSFAPFTETPPPPPPDTASPTAG